MSGLESAGVRVVGGNTAYLGGNTIEVSGDGSAGVFVEDGSEACISSDTIMVSGKECAGVYIYNGGTADISEGTITTSGDDSAGVHVADGGAADISGGDISGRYGVYIDNNGTADISGGTIAATNKGIYLYGGTAYLSGGTITVAATLIGIDIYNGTAYISGGAIMAAGEYSLGISVNGGGTAYISGGTIMATGDDSLGIYVALGEADITVSPDLSITGAIYGDDGINFVPFLIEIPGPVSIPAGKTGEVELVGVGTGISFEVDSATPAALGAGISGNTVTLQPIASGSLVLTATKNLSNLRLTIPVTVHTPSSSRGGGGGSGSPTTKVGNVSVPYYKRGSTAELDIKGSILDKILENSGKQATFNLSGISGITSVVAPASVFETLAEKGKGAEFRMPAGNVNISPAALASIAGQAAGDDVTISLGTVDPSDLTPEQQEAVGSATVYDLSILSGGRNISDFEGSLTLTLPCTLKEGESAEGVSIWYMDDAGNLTSIPCTYDPITGTLSCTLTHLSYYVVGYKTSSEVEAPAPPAWENPFSDVQESHWFYEGVAFAVQNRLFTGTGSSTFSPDDNMTRGMLVTVLYRLAGEPGAGQSSFSDVSRGIWYGEAVAWAWEQGIVKGYGSGKFRPDAPVTREQMAVILYNYAESRGYDLSAAGDTAQFADRAKVSDWAVDAMEWAVGAGLITGKSQDILDPGGNASRAQVAEILMRFVERIIK